MLGSSSIESIEEVPWPISELIYNYDKRKDLKTFAYSSSIIFG